MNPTTCCRAFCLVLAVALLGTAQAQTKRAEHFDIRKDAAESSVGAVAGLRASQAAGAAKGASAVRGTMAAGRAKLAASVPGLHVEVNETTQAAEVVEVEMGASALSAPSKAKPEAAVREFVSGNAALFGLSKGQAGQLKTRADSANPAGNISWVELQQTLNDIPVFQATLRAAVRKDGAVARTTGNLAAGLDETTLPTRPKITPAQAAAAAAKTIDVVVDEASLQTASVADEGRTNVLSAGPFEREIKTELIYFPLEPGVATLAYSMVLWEKKDAWYTIVDAQTGQLLWQKNITNDQTQAATYSVYDSDSPTPISPSNATPGSGIQGTAVNRTSFNLVSEMPAPFTLTRGWLPDTAAGVNASTTGNNVDAGLDLDTVNGIDASGRAVGTGRVFNFAYTPAGQPGGQAPSGAAFRNGVVTNLFFWTNRFHDRLYQYGFTEQFGNFQQNNFSLGGVGNDHVLAEAQDSSGTNNANFATPPDGSSGRMQMYLFNLTNPNRDGSLDQEIVIHELAHGLSNRLHANGSGLNTAQSGGMGEGWSDFYGRALLATADEDVAGVYASGAYATFQLSTIGTNNSYYGIRRFPYAIKSTVGPGGRPHNPLTFADIDPAKVFTGDGAYAKSALFSDAALEVHNVGEIWCMALLEVRARIIQRMGFAGNDRMLQIVTDAMKMDVASPTLIQARNTIIAADQVGFAGEDVPDIWAGFAAVGMGFGAGYQNGASVLPTSTTQNPAAVVESFITPNLLLGTVTLTDAGGNGDGFPDPGEQIVLTVQILNPTALAKGAASNVTASVAGGTAVPYGTINSGANAIQNIPYTVPVVPAGTRLKIVVAIDSSFGPVGPVPHSFFLTAGQPVNGLVEAFDTGSGSALPTGWGTSKTGAGTAWTVASTAPDSFPRHAFCANVASTGSAEMVTPTIAITSSAAELSFRNSYNLETTASQGIFWDGMVLEVSFNGGGYQDIVAAGGTFLAGGYNATLRSTPNPLSNRNAWGGLSGGSTSSPAYITTKVLLPASANGKNARFKWIVGADSSAVASGSAGVRIDGVTVASGAKIGQIPNRKPTIGNQSFGIVDTRTNGFVLGTVVASDQDPGQTLTYTILSGNTGGTFALNSANGQLTVANDAMLDFDSIEQFKLIVQVTDNGTLPGPETSDPATITIDVRKPGMTPEITGQATVVTLEDMAREIEVLDVTINDTDSTYPADFTITVLDGDNYTHSGNTITPAPDFFGMLTVPVKVTDGETESDAFPLEVSVTPVNDAPSFVKGPNQAVIEGEARTVTNWATAISPGPSNESAQELNFVVSTSNDAFFSALPSVTDDGTLSFTVGQLLSTVTVSVALQDNGGTDDDGVDTSATQTFLISNTSAANDPPSFFVGPDQAAALDAGPQTVSSFATEILPGPPDEVAAGQTVSFDVQAVDPTLFAVLPTIDASGKLTYTPSSTALAASKQTLVKVKAMDSAGASSAEQTFIIAITTFQGHFGDYNGLAMPALGSTLSAEKTGLLSLKFTAKGSYTGKLRLGTFSFSLKGIIDNAGLVRFGKLNEPKMVLVRKGQASLILAMRLDVAGDSDQLTGTISPEAADPTSVILADRAKIYTALAPPAFKGKFTVLFEKPKSPILLADPLPQGDGFGNMDVSDRGLAKVTGQLADGSKFVYTNALSKTNFWPVWVPLSKGQGALAGRVQFREVPGVSDVDGTDLLWFRPQDLKSKGIPYANGWPKGIMTNLVGAKYLPGLAVADSIDPSLDPAVAHNANLILTAGGLPVNFPTKVLSLSGKKITCPLDAAIVVTFTPATGLFKGSFYPPGTQPVKTTLQGAVLQTRKKGSGYTAAPKAQITGTVVLDP